MAISFIGGANNDTTSGVSTLSVTYSPTAGHTICVFLLAGGSVTAATCSDSAGNLLHVGPTATNTVTAAAFYYTAPSGITSFTANWTTARQAGIVVMEYAGSLNVNANLANNTNTGTSANPFITATLQDANDWIVAGLGGANITTIVTGNQREQVVSSTGRPVGADNTASTASSVSISGGMTSSAWAAVLLELVVRPNVWDNDVENQYSIAVDTQTAAATRAIQSIAELSYGDNAEKGYYATGLALTAYDNDSENQKQQDGLLAYTMLQVTEYGIGDNVENTYYAPGVINGWDTDSDQQLSQDQLNPVKYNYQYTDDDWEWNTLKVISGILDIVLMSYYGYSALPAAKEDPTTWTQLLITVSPIVDYTWDGDENQLPQPGWTVDTDLLDTGVEKISLVFEAARYVDFDYQFQQQLWNQDDVDTSVELIVITVQDDIPQNPWVQQVQDFVEEQAKLITPLILDSDAEQQLQQPLMNQDIIEEQAKIVVINVFDDIEDKAWDNYFKDILEEQNRLPTIPVREIDNEAEQQLSQPDYYKDHLSDEAVEKITIPPTVPQLTAFDTDADYQSQWLPLFGQDDVMDSSIELIQLNIGVDHELDDIQERVWLDWNNDNVDEKSNYLVIPIVQDEPLQQPFILQVQDVIEEQAQLVILTIQDEVQQNPWTFQIQDQIEELIQNVVLVITDIDYQQQQVQQIQDQIEEVQLPIIPTRSVDNDLEQQFQQPEWYKDVLADEMVEKVQVIVVTFDYTWDNDSEQQMQQVIQLSDDVIDNGVELIVLPPFINIDEIVGEEEE